METVVMTREMLNNLRQSTALSYNPIERQKQRLACLNSSPGTLKDYDCPKCNNRGQFYQLDERDCIYSIPCNCMTIRKNLEHLKQSGLEKVIRKMTFDKYQAIEPWQRKLKLAAMEYAKNPKGWFAIFGQSGCGKTHLCTAICRELLYQGKEIRYLSWRDEISLLKGLYDDQVQQLKKLEDFLNVPVLYIDDLFKTGSVDGSRPKPTAADVQVAFQILNHRAMNDLCTILSSEMLPNEILAMDEATGGRILENAKPNIYTVTPNRKRNYRLQYNG